MPPKRGFTSVGYYDAPAAARANCATATASIVLNGDQEGEVTLSFSNGTAHPPSYGIEPTSADLIRTLNDDGSPGVRNMEHAQILLGLVRDAMLSGGWKITTRGGPRTSYSFRNPHHQGKRR